MFFGWWWWFVLAKIERGSVTVKEEGGGGNVSGQLPVSGWDALRVEAMEDDLDSQQRHGVRVAERRLHSAMSRLSAYPDRSHLFDLYSQGATSSAWRTCPTQRSTKVSPVHVSSVTV